MNGMIYRTVAVTIVLGLAIWGPGVPLVLAQLEVTQDVREQCDLIAKENPELGSIIRDDVLPKLEEATKPDAAPEVKAEAKIVEQTALSIHDAGATVATLEVPDTAKLQETLTQTPGVSAAVAQELAQKAQSALAEAKTAFAKSDPGKAEAALKAFREECMSRYGVDPSRTLGGTGEGKLDLGRIAFDSKGDFLGKAMECHTACEMLREKGIEFRGAPPSPEEAAKMIEKMNVSPEEKAKMVEMAKAYEGFCRDGSFKEFQVIAARESYEKMMGEHGFTPEMAAKMISEHSGGMTPEMAAKMMAEHGMIMDPRGFDASTAGHYHDFAGNVVTPEAMWKEMAAGGMAMDPRGFDARTAGNAVTPETMYREMATHYSDAPRTETSGTAEGWHGCSGLTEAEKTTHRAHGHCNPSD